MLIERQTGKVSDPIPGSKVNTNTLCQTRGLVYKDLRIFYESVRKNPETGYAQKIWNQSLQRTSTAASGFWCWSVVTSPVLVRVCLRI